VIAQMMPLTISCLTFWFTFLGQIELNGLPTATKSCGWSNTDSIFIHIETKLFKGKSVKLIVSIIWAAKKPSFIALSRILKGRRDLTVVFNLKKTGPKMNLNLIENLI
jgi:hypothetical protein